MSMQSCPQNAVYTKKTVETPNGFLNNSYAEIFGAIIISEKFWGHIHVMF